MRVSTQLVAGYVLAVAAIVAVGVLSQLQLRAGAEDIHLIGEEWAEMETIALALSTLHFAHAHPQERSGLLLAAERVEALATAAAAEAKEAKEVGEEHDLREVRMFEGVVGALREAATAPADALAGIEERAHGLAAEFWKEDEGRVPATLSAIEGRGRRLRTLNLVVAGSLLLLPLLFLAYMNARIARPLEDIQRRVEAIGGLEGGAPPSAGSMGRLAATIERMAVAVERQRQDLEEEIEARTAQLRHANRLGGLGKIAAAVAHEINNPLGSIGLCVEGLRQSLVDDDPDPADVDRYVDTIRREIDRCTVTTRKMLTYARFKPEEPREIAVREILGHALDLVAGQAERARVALDVENLAEHVRVSGEPGQLQQVIVNLLLNAVDASPPHSAVTLRVDVDGDEAVLRVTDHGPGVPPEERATVFDPFVTTKRAGEGTGLGLAISREIVEAHGGRLDLLESGPDEGAVFEVRLPCGQA